MPTWVARIVVGVICGLGFGKSRVFGHADFDGNLNLDDYRGASEHASAGSTSNVWRT